MVSNKKALDCAETLVQFCKEQNGCQNCLFRKFGADRWDCHIGESGWWDLSLPERFERVAIEVKAILERRSC